ncbi:MAG: Bpu10I family restriction endonuclease [Planctomycetota bacterium]
MKFPTPHLEKLNATLENEKLPTINQTIIKAAIVRYNGWVKQLREVTGSTTEETVGKMVALLNEYRLYLDVEVIFDREEDFLYRQKGQTKLDNSVIEEFLPHLVFKCVMGGKDVGGIVLGPNTTFSAIYFASSLDAEVAGGGLTVRTKDQDFAIGKAIHLRASHDATFKDSLSKTFYLGYVVAECKTNLDKTMFQEAVATANDTKSAVTGAKYYLLCEWLDMTPQSTAPTDIDEVIILRKQKRLSSNVRGAFGSFDGRKKGRDAFVKFLKENPFRPEMFLRFVNHIKAVLGASEPEEVDVLKDGYF